MERLTGGLGQLEPARTAKGVHMIHEEGIPVDLDYCVEGGACMGVDVHMKAKIFCGELVENGLAVIVVESLVMLHR